MADLSTDEQRLQALLENPNAPESVKRDAVAAFRALKSPQQSPSMVESAARGAWQAGAGPLRMLAPADRPQAQGIGATVGGLAALPGAAALGPAAPLAPVAGGVLGNLVGGQAWDVAQQWMGNQPKQGLGEAAQSVTQDIIPAVGAEGIGVATGAILSPVLNRIINSRMAKAVSRMAKAAPFKRVGMPYLPSDISESTTVALTERAAGTPLTGHAVKQGLRRQQATRAGELTTAQLGEPGTQESLLATGLRTQAAVDQAVKRWKTTSGQLFDQIEAAAGAEKVVPTAPIRDAITQITQRKQHTAQLVGSLTRNTERGLAAVNPPPDVTPVTLFGPQGEPMQLNEVGQQILDLAMREEKLPFSLVRELEAQLGEAQKLASTQYVRGLRKGEYGRLYGGVRRAIDAYMTTPDAGDLAPALAAAKQQWATGKELFRGLGQAVKGRQAEQVVRGIIRPKNLEGILDLKHSVDDETWGVIVGEWKAQLVREATTKDGLVPTKLAKIIGEYDRGGTLDAILTGAEADSLRELSGVFGQMGRAEREFANVSRTAGTYADAAAITTAINSLMRGDPLTAGGIGVSYGAVPAAAMGTMRRWPDTMAGVLESRPWDILPTIADPRLIRTFLHQGTAQRER